MPNCFGHLAKNKVLEVLDGNKHVTNNVLEVLEIKNSVNIVVFEVLEGQTL